MIPHPSLRRCDDLIDASSRARRRDNVRAIISKLPENPRERNFWRLLRDRAVPRETYDYVLSVFSAAVICEDPQLFGFDGPCPRIGHAAEEAGAPQRTHHRG